MKRLHCNGKNGFCDRYDGVDEPTCAGCEFADGSGSKFVENMTEYDRIRNFNIDEMAVFITSIIHERDIAIQKKLAENGISTSLIELDFDIQCEIQKRLLESEVQ